MSLMTLSAFAVVSAYVVEITYTFEEVSEQLGVEFILSDNI